MILIDSRAGSKELVKPLAAMGLPVEETMLDYGDLAFLGRGENGKKVFVGIEHKKLPDLVQSLTNDRLAGHQLPGMLGMFDRCWLIVEGEWDHDPEGRVTMFKAKRKRSSKRLRGSPLAVALEQRLLTLEIRGGLHVRCCPTQHDTVRFLCGLYRFWTDKDLDEHKSHLAIHAPDLDRGLLIPMSDFRRVIAQIPCIGLRTSAAVEKYFWDADKNEGSFRRMMLATEAEWAEIETINEKTLKPRRIGASRAKQITEALA